MEDRQLAERRAKRRADKLEPRSTDGKIDEDNAVEGLMEADAALEEDQADASEQSLDDVSAHF